MSCWLFMAWFHIHLSAPSQQMGLRIYAFLQQWCYQSGKLPLDGRRDNKRGIWLDQYHSTRLYSANSIKVLERLKCLSQMAGRRGLVKSFVGLILFLFPERVSLVHTRYLWLLWKGSTLCLHSAAVWLNVFFFPVMFFFFVRFLFICVCRTQTPRRSWITYSFGSPKLIEFLSSFPFREGMRESKNYASPRRSKSIFCLFILFPI